MPRSTRRSSTTAPDRGRFSARRKMEVVVRVLRGEDLDALSREIGVTAATIARWRDLFLAGGQAAVKQRLGDERDDEISQLRSKVGELTMENELLYQRARRAEGRDPFAPRRSNW